MNGMGKMPPVVKNFLIINVAVFFLAYIVQSQFGQNLTRILGLYYFESEYFQPFQYVTHLFMHASIPHLFFNMFALWMFGRVLETVWGSKRFFTYYIIVGIGAALFHTLVGWYDFSQVQEAARAFSNTPSPQAFSQFVNEYFPQYYDQIYEKLLSKWEDNPDNSLYIERAMQFKNELLQQQLNIPTVGASGAVFGILLAFGMLFPNTKLMLIFPPIPIKAKYFVIGYGIIELFAGVANRSGDNVAHFAHLGGMLFGFILLKYWYGRRTPGSFN